LAQQVSSRSMTSCFACRRPTGSARYRKAVAHCARPWLGPLRKLVVSLDVLDPRHTSLTLATWPDHRQPRRTSCLFSRDRVDLSGGAACLFSVATATAGAPDRDREQLSMQLQRASPCRRFAGRPRWDRPCRAHRRSQARHRKRISRNPRASTNSAGEATLHRPASIAFVRIRKSAVPCSCSAWRRRPAIVTDTTIYAARTFRTQSISSATNCSPPARCRPRSMPDPMPITKSAARLTTYSAAEINRRQARRR
jgi:hypothetical protein